MLIDDSEVDLFIHRKLISKYFPDFNIVEFHNANDALNFLKFNSNKNKLFRIIPDFILLDIGMPLKDGFDFLNEYNCISFPGTRIPALVVITCSINPEYKNKCEKNNHVEAFFLKPLMAENILKIFNPAVLNDIKA
jgi:response regulator RpfG family c-di-GMP phosphodiesterase